VKIRKNRLTLTYCCLVVFLFVYFARPEDWVPHLTLPLAKISGTLVIAAFLLSGRMPRHWPREGSFLTLLLLQFFLAVVLSPVWKGGAFRNTLDFLKVVPIIYLIMVWTINTMSRLRWVIFLQVACVTVASALSVWKQYSFHGRLLGFLGGNYSNPNDLACQIAICLPFYLAFLIRTRNTTGRLAWGAVISFLTYVIVLTGSRGGFLASSVVVAGCMWEFAIKGRRRFLLVFALVGFIFLNLYGGQLLQRFGALSNQQQDPSAFASAESRTDLLWKSLMVTASHPFFGVGLGNFQILSGSWHGTHNSYTEMSAEAGVPALILYLIVWWRAFFYVRAVKRYRRGRPELRVWAKALMLSLLAFLVAAFFSNYAFQYFPYFLIAYTSCLFRIAQKEKERAKVTTRATDNSISDPELHQQWPEAESAWASI
jgi:O-antigen ligase